MNGATILRIWTSKDGKPYSQTTCRSWGDAEDLLLSMKQSAFGREIIKYEIVLEQ